MKSVGIWLFFSDALETVSQRVLAAHRWSDSPVDPLPLFYGVVDETTVSEQSAMPALGMI